MEVHRDNTGASIAMHTLQKLFVATATLVWLFLVVGSLDQLAIWFGHMIASTGATHGAIINAVLSAWAIMLICM
jgi:hypothetical protein